MVDEWLRQDSDLWVICPDSIRDQLYGDPIIQGDWEAVKGEIKRQFQQAIAQGQSIIYDATNVKRGWREDLIGTRPDLRWIAWQVMTEGFAAVYEVPLDEQQQVDWEKMRSLLSY